MESLVKALEAFESRCSEDNKFAKKFQHSILSEYTKIGDSTSKASTWLEHVSTIICNYDVDEQTDVGKARVYLSGLKDVADYVKFATYIPKKSDASFTLDDSLKAELKERGVL